MDAADWVDNDLMVADNLESLQVTLAGTQTTYDVDSALRRMVSIREAAASGGAYTAQDVKFYLPKQCLDTVPSIGSLILADEGEEIWTVIASTRPVHRTQWCAICRLSLLNSDLQDVITIEKPVYGRDADQAQSVTWVTFAANVKAKFWQSSRNVVDLDSRRSEHIDASVYIKDVAGITADMRIKMASGTYYGLNEVTVNELAMLTKVTVQDFSFPLVN